MFHDVPKNPEVIDTPKNLSPAVNEIKPQRGTTPETALGVINSLFRPLTESPQTNNTPDMPPCAKSLHDTAGNPEELQSYREVTISQFELNNSQKGCENYLDNQEIVHFYTTYKERLDCTPSDDNPALRWEGERGESACYPTGEYSKKESRANDVSLSQKAKDLMALYGRDCIEYRNGEADFSPFSAATVTIPNMTVNRYNSGGNFEQADRACAIKWNQEKHDGHTDWNIPKIEMWRREHHYSWHECCDTRTMQLLPMDIHNVFPHPGGVLECKNRDHTGGNFDD